MSDRFEQQLRCALKSVDPGQAFTDRVMNRITAQPAPPLQAPGRPGFHWLSAGLIVSLVLGVGISYQEHLRHSEGLEARRQLIEALRLTDQKLNRAYRIAKSGT